LVENKDINSDNMEIREWTKDSRCEVNNNGTYKINLDDEFEANITCDITNKSIVNSFLANMNIDKGDNDEDLSNIDLFE